jgi:hypothetical protein
LLWAALAGLTVIGYGSFVLFPSRFFLLGIDHLGVWFLDTFAILASNDALARGLDPYAANPLDYLQRPHVYSEWWLGLRHLGLTRASNPWLGVLFNGLFLGASLLWLRPRSRGELGWYGVVLLSPPMLLGFSRANNDLLVFALLLAVVPLLRSRHRWARFLAVVPIAVATGLKFYPAAAGVVLLAGIERTELRMRLLCAVAALALVLVDVVPDARRVSSLLPAAQGLMTFSAFHALEAFGASRPVALGIGLLLAGLAVVGFTRMKVLAGWNPAPDDPAWLAFIAGAAVLTGCFLTGANHAYRWVFAVALAPLLWRLWHDDAAPRLARRFAMISAMLLLAVLWLDPLASVALNLAVGHVPPAAIVELANRFFFCEQPITWVFFWCLIGFLTHFVGGALRTLFAKP